MYVYVDKEREKRKLEVGLVPAVHAHRKQLCKSHGAMRGVMDVLNKGEQANRDAARRGHFTSLFLTPAGIFVITDQRQYISIHREIYIYIYICEYYYMIQYKSDIVYIYMYVYYIK